MQIETQTIITKNAIIRIHHPDLTDEERAKRMKAIELAAIRLVQATVRPKHGSGCRKMPPPPRHSAKVHKNAPEPRGGKRGIQTRGLDAVLPTSFCRCGRVGHPLPTEGRFDSGLPGMIHSSVPPTVAAGQAAAKVNAYDTERTERSIQSGSPAPAGAAFGASPENGGNQGSGRNMAL